MERWGQSTDERLRIHAVHILLGSDERLLEFLFHHKELRLKASVPELLREAQNISGRDQSLIKIAIDLWCGEANSQFNDLLTVIDDDQIRLRILMALAYRLEMVEAWEALSCCE